MDEPTQTPPPKKRQKRNKLPLSQTDRKMLYRRELKKMNIHKPAFACTARDVATMKALKDMLRETWHTLWEEANDFRLFSEKQIRFAQAWARNGRKGYAKSMREAGYLIKDDENLAIKARENLRQPYFENLVKAFELEEKARMKINVEDVVKWFNDIATAAMASEDYTNANRAMENLAKYLGMFVERKEILHKTVHSREELDARIAELTQVLKDSEAEIDSKLRIN